LASARDELVPPDEAARLAAVRRYDILDTPPDGAFDRITALAARLCDVPISTITIVDEDRIWFKSKVGVEVDEIGRDPGLCASAVLGEVPYVVTDAAIDPRTLDNPLVRGELGLRFYVGVPLRTSDGYSLGTLNVIDGEAREIRQEQIDTLSDLAAVVMDELELRLAARQAIELEAVREATRYRDAILAGVSHEVRTPLAVLKGIASLEGASTSTDERLRATLRRQVAHLDWLMSQFLDFTHVEGDRLPRPRAEPVDLGGIVAEAIEITADRDAEVTDTTTDAGATVVADPDRVLQIVLELLNNAVRFGPAGGRIELDVVSSDDGLAGISVTDRGPGIDAGDLERIFDRSHRDRGSTGSGVGLYVARALAEAQGGRIEVASRPGEGSRFTVLLPTGAGVTR
jgi:signal transduction histidine kinase